jgi:hypothetical protein
MLGGGVAPDFFPLLQDVSARPTIRMAAIQDLSIRLPFPNTNPRAETPRVRVVVQ